MGELAEGQGVSKRYHVVESNLERTAARWKWLRFLQHVSTLGGIVSLLVLLLGLALVRGWLVNQPLAVAAIVLVSAGALIALVLVVVKVVGDQLERKWLAGSLEKTNPSLLDRLNTLIFLERTRENAALDSFERRIVHQTQGVLIQTPLKPPFSAGRSLAHLAAFLGVLAVTILVYQHYSPWDHLRAAQPLAAAREQGNPTNAPPSLELPDSTVTEAIKDWGEIRITEPGQDLRVTKVDAVPLQIEAATSQALTNVGWFHTLNGADEQRHALPPPKEPRFAVYQPVLYLDELKVAEWDVLTYYAKASTEKNAYASEIFFVEVRPFHEDILKLPGGAGGKACKGMNELSALIERQQQIIRQTHRYQQQPHADARLQEQDRGKLSQGESALGDATKHLAAQFAAELEEAPVGGLVEELAAAQKTLNQASGTLSSDLIPDAQQQEREALNQLVAARKHFQKVIAENPDQFSEQPDDEPTPGADAGDKLQQMAEFRNEQKAAQDFVKAAVDKQRGLAQRANRQQPTTFNQLAPEAKALEKSLEDFQAQHPQAFRHADAELQAAEQAMKNAAQNLEQASAGARKDSQQAVEKLEQLQQAMQKQDAAQQLADAYKLKELLDRQIKTLGQCENPGGSGSGGQLRQTTSAAKATTDQLKQLVEHSPAGDAFGPKLRESLSDANKQSLDQRLDAAGKAQGDEAKQQAAAQAKGSLEKVAQAFNESQPQALQQARQNDALNGSPADGFERGIEMLESLLQRRESNRRLSPQDESRQQREAWQRFEKAVPDRFGNNEQTKTLLLKLEEGLKDQPTPLDDVMIQKLIAELKHFSTEVKDATAPKLEDPQLTNIDPSKLPPAYRGRIEKYFQKLSERK